MGKNDSKERSAPDEIYNFLRIAILEEKLHPGDRLVERKIAQELNVSRTPIREAIRKLEHEGLVEHQPNCGVVVTSLKPRDVWELYSIRAVLEGLSARLASQRIIPEEITELETTLSKMEQALDKDDKEDLELLHKLLHRQIVIAAHSPRLEQMVFKLTDYLTLFTRMGYSTPGRRRAASDEHRALVEMIKKGCLEEAEKIARKHNERSCEAYFIHWALSRQDPVI